MTLALSTRHAVTTLAAMGARFAVVVGLVVLTACTHVNRSMLIMSTVAIVCDAAQTTRASTSPEWGGALQEANPILGRAPSAPVILGYFTLAVAINAAVWHFAPKHFKSVVPTMVTATQLRSIVRNTGTTETACGVPL